MRGIAAISARAAPARGSCYGRDIPTDRTYAVEVELPVEAFRHRRWSPAEVAADLRLLWLVDVVRLRQVGHAKAAELAGLPLASFVRVLGEHHVSPFDLDDVELDREIAAGVALGRR